jgi:organic hydroperoxide reductase OsmC/OhrA
MSASVTSIASVRPKEFHFPLTVVWVGGRRVRAQVEEKQPVDVCPPILFSGDDATTWSPEDFFVAAAASCLAVTFTGIAERAGLEFDDLVVAADGICGQRPDGRFGFIRVRLRLELEIPDEDDDRQARDLAERAEDTCLVAASLDVSIETDIVINGR